LTFNLVLNSRRFLSSYFLAGSCSPHFFLLGRSGLVLDRVSTAVMTKGVRFFFLPFFAHTSLLSFLGRTFYRLLRPILPHPVYPVSPNAPGIRTAPSCPPWTSVPWFLSLPVSFPTPSFSLFFFAVNSPFVFAFFSPIHEFVRPSFMSQFFPFF